MKKGVIRIVSGALLLLLQALSIAGNIKAGTFYAPSPPVSLAQLAYDMIVLASANLLGILGAILLIFGLIASHKAKKPASKETESPQLPGTETAIKPELEQKPDTADSYGNLPTPELPLPKARFCKLCGDPIDPVTRKCTGCKKQYFRPPVFADKHYFIAATAVACIVIVILVFAIVSQSSAYESQLAELSEKLAEAEDDASYQSRVAETRKSQIEDLNRALDARDKTIKELQDENLNMLVKIGFYDRYAVIVGDDGTKKYHKYGCSYLDTSDGLWIFNTENAKYQGYKPCSHCCD